MKYQLDKGAHSVYTLQYQLICVVTYRRKVFETAPIIDFLRARFYEISETFEVEILVMEPDQDHVHVVFKAKPTLVLPGYSNALKTITSREIRRHFPEVRQKLWRNQFWSRSYFLATTGQVTLDVLKNYVEHQNK